MLTHVGFRNERCVASTVVCFTELLDLYVRYSGVLTLDPAVSCLSISSDTLGARWLSSFHNFGVLDPADSVFRTASNP